ncbi:30S ribosomal protein S17 [Methylogaea oryzae]|uniref:Small ribosomal subunit protein uS17 n=1 Tax=Methylogaea oryzae TaxID=1295382 RepID=A0A8D4VLI4_9GAMM|nr:30S ribosomal protein S17 [Methylogaea oryzae]BBL69786.1 30S ribosomal protein S17 [Methylogaea oryzae]
MSESEKKIRTVTGRVVSAKGEKSVTVSVERLVPHALYGKITRKTTKVRAHDEQGDASEGDLVVLTPSRPMSKSKSWQVLKVVEKAPV